MSLYTSIFPLVLSLCSPPKMKIICPWTAAAEKALGLGVSPLGLAKVHCACSIHVKSEQLRKRTDI